MSMDKIESIACLTLSTLNDEREKMAWSKWKLLTETKQLRNNFFLLCADFLLLLLQKQQRITKKWEKSFAHNNSSSTALVVVNMVALEGSWESFFYIIVLSHSHFCL